jgi:hypothetical protein
MSTKLSDVYVGVVDFFSVLLPGAFLTFLFKNSHILHEIFDPLLPAIQGRGQGWAIFLVASYLFGRFIYLVASYLDHLYDFLVRGTRLPRIRHNVRRVLISSRDPDVLPDRVKVIRDKRLSNATDADRELINAYQWATANLLLQHPAALAEVQRYEADSKFFRSLVIVLGLVSIALAFKTAWFTLVACVILTVLSLWGFLKRRWKGVTMAYTYYITSEAIPKPDGASEETRPTAKEAEPS